MCLPKMGIENFWNEVTNTRQEVSLSEAKAIISTDLEKPTVAIDAFLLFVLFYLGTWASVSKRETIKSFDPIIDNTVKRCEDLQRKFKAEGIRTIWCLDGDKNRFKLATDQRALERQRTQNLIFKYYVSIIAAKSKSHANDLEAFKRKYSLIANTMPSNFSHDDVFTDRIDEMENSLAKKFASSGFFPADFSKTVIERLQDKLTFIRVPEISEGEKLACTLVLLGVALAVYTTDSDSVILGARFVIKEVVNFGGSKTYDQYHLYSYSRIIKHLGMTHDQLLKLAIILGNDFNKKVYGDGIAAAKKKVSDPEFDIIEYNIAHLGTLNVSTCVNELMIKKSDYDATLRVIQLTINKAS